MSKVKDILYPRTGTEPANMQLTLYADIAAAEAGGDGGTALDDDAKSLSDYGAAAACFERATGGRLIQVSRGPRASWAGCTSLL